MALHLTKEAILIKNSLSFTDEQVNILQSVNLYPFISDNRIRRCVVNVLNKSRLSMGIRATAMR